MNQLKHPQKRTNQNFIEKKYEKINVPENSRNAIMIRLLSYCYRMFYLNQFFAVKKKEDRAFSGKKISY